MIKLEKILSECGSTNEELKKEIQVQTLADGSFIQAKTQFQGKGRLGRSWSSPDGNLYLSVYYELEKEELLGLPLWAGVCVFEVLKKYIPEDSIKLKWPNDLYVSDQKICGILCENIVQNQKHHVVLGIGINVERLPEGSFLVPPTCLYTESASRPTVDEIRDEVLVELEKLISHLRSKTIQPYIECFEKNAYFQNQDAVEIEGLVYFWRGLGEKGEALVWDEEGKERSFYSGEVSLRRRS